MESVSGIMSSFCALPRVPSGNVSNCAAPGQALGNQTVFNAATQSLRFTISQNMDFSPVYGTTVCPLDSNYQSCTYDAASNMCKCKSRVYRAPAAGNMGALMLYTLVDANVGEVLETGWLDLAYTSPPANGQVTVTGTMNATSGKARYKNSDLFQVSLPEPTRHNAFLLNTLLH